MTDMLVRLCELREEPLITNTLQADGIRFVRAMALDRVPILSFVAAEFFDTCPGWVDECDACILRQPATCYIAIHNKEVVGFACYDGSAKGFIGPVGVAKDYRCRGVARSLLLHVCNAMLADGYAYAITGWVSSEEYYAKALNAIAIPGSVPGVYHRLIKPPVA